MGNTAILKKIDLYSFITIVGNRYAHLQKWLKYSPLIAFFKVVKYWLYSNSFFNQFCIWAQLMFETLKFLKLCLQFVFSFAWIECSNHNFNSDCNIGRSLHISYKHSGKRRKAVNYFYGRECRKLAHFQHVTKARCRLPEQTTILIISRLAFADSKH